MGDIEIVYPGLASFFQTSEPARDKYSSRLFGLFSEDLVRDWCSAPDSRYVNAGRPTLFEPGEIRGYTLDFAFQQPGKSGILVAEMKCELEFENYRYLTLETASQIEHHRSPAFLRFRELARDPARYEVRIAGKPVEVLGTVLVWGAASEAGKIAAMNAYGFTDVLTVDECLSDLQRWGDATLWPQRIARLRGWSTTLFDGLLGPVAEPGS